MLMWDRGEMDLKMRWGNSDWGKEMAAIFVSGGPMEAGKIDIADLDVNKIELVDAMVAAADDKYSDADVQAIERSACPTCGSCSGMFTANSMNCPSWLKASNISWKPSPS